MKLKIGFSKSKTNAIGSRLIQWWMGTNFSHTFLIFDLPKFQDKVIFQAVGSGLNFIAETNFLDHNDIVTNFEIEINEDQYYILINKCILASGKNYGYLQNIGDVIAKIFRLNKNPFNDGTNCSEWVAECLVTIDLEAFSKFVDLNLVTPKDVYNYLDGKYGKTSKY